MSQRSAQPTEPEHCTVFARRRGCRTPGGGVPRGTIPRSLVTLIVVGMSGCSTGLRGPTLGDLYDRAAMHHDAERHPVIVIPGILGSRLEQQGTRRVVWGAFSDGYANPSRADGARLFALPMREGAALRDLRDDVVPAGVLDRVRIRLFGLPVELNAYTQILATLGAGGYRDELLGEAGAVDYGREHYTCFQFGYDWRRDIVESAARLHEFILQRRAYVQARHREKYGTEPADVKFDIVAHSMGGLVARYYLMYGPMDLPADGSLPPVTWEGAKYVDRAILVGTPNAGSIKALSQLVEGATLSPIIPSYPPALVGTAPAVYELLPRSRHRVLTDIADPDGATLDLFDVAVWERMSWGLASPSQTSVLATLLPDTKDPAERRRIALDHLSKCLKRARQFHAALDATAPPPADLDLYLFAGDALPTDESVIVDGRTGRLRVGRRGAGDGTVLRTSALMDERSGGEWRPGVRTPIAWRNATFLFRDHLGLTQDTVFHDNVLYLLLEDRRP